MEEIRAFPLYGTNKEAELYFKQKVIARSEDISMVLPHPKGS